MNLCPVKISCKKELNMAANFLHFMKYVHSVISIVSAPDDTFRTPKFSTRQLSNCTFSQVDPEAVSYLGYLPQDLIGLSVFDFYHPDDTAVIKEMYEKGKSP